LQRVVRVKNPRPDPHAARVQAFLEKLFQGPRIASPDFTDDEIPF